MILTNQSTQRIIQSRIGTSQRQQDCGFWAVFRRKRHYRRMNQVHRKRAGEDSLNQRCNATEYCYGYRNPFEHCRYALSCAGIRDEQRVTVNLVFRLE
jgi:hypothetical protein